MFDFLLFENFHIASHHKIDVLLIAKMLKSQGMKVAIFDIYHEDKEDDIEGIPVLHWTSSNKVPDDSWMTKRHSLIETLWKGSVFQIHQHRYMKEVKAFIEDKANAFYCGSYHNGMSTILFQIQKPCYWWGLRSDRMKFTWVKLLPSPISGLHILLERKRFLKNSYQRLFVSNQIIMDEHERLGVPRDRMVIREERVVENEVDANTQALDENISFLVIGQLRKEKHITTTIAAFKQASIEGATLKLIGRSQGEYEKDINKAIAGDKRIIRQNEFLDYSDFNRHFSQSHFVLFADEKGRSCITNGTMMEAMIRHRPIICPDYKPYNYYVNTYNVGVLYRPNDVNSYTEALLKAKKLGVNYFQEPINEFLKTIKFDQVAKILVSDIEQLEQSI